MVTWQTRYLPGAHHGMQRDTQGHSKIPAEPSRNTEHAYTFYPVIYAAKCHRQVNLRNTFDRPLPSADIVARRKEKQPMGFIF
jgi:hypothetical protein